MAFLRTNRCYNFYNLLKHTNPSPSEIYSIFPKPLNSSFNSSICNRPISISAQHSEKSNGFWTGMEDNKKGNKPLHAMFAEAVGLSERTDESDSEETDELKKKLKKLEEEVRSLKDRDMKRLENGNSTNGYKKGGTVSKATSLTALFGVEKPKKTAEEIVYKKLSPEMVVFASYLQKKGYFDKANFIPKNDVFDASCFENNYGRDFLKYAAESFGRDNREITKWLSGSDLKKVALFGCPSTGKKHLFSAKKMRTFFKISEETVCDRCVLKQSCKYVNQSFENGETNLDLVDVMRVITLYALESTYPELVVADEVKGSVKRLLEEAMKLVGDTPEMTGIPWH